MAGRCEREVSGGRERVWGGRMSRGGAERGVLWTYVRGGYARHMGFFCNGAATTENYTLSLRGGMPSLWGKTVCAGYDRHMGQDSVGGV